MDASMLCLAERGFNGYAHWAAVSTTSAQLLLRCANYRKLPVVKELGDGSYLSVVYPGGTNSKKQRQESTEWSTVRVVDYALPNVAGVATKQPKTMVHQRGRSIQAI